ncbi:enoyl-CoA hydratase [Bermanella marisrubri]|uniref:Enoyl-CoA hydratase n=1 Tax=Bermanella marisrubri TaxID=207949 RepID=Q1MZM4_9GAMM|nr:enoyl-CoA hydratase [Bermanella marisrubri]EAT11387.1 enoyl-CoA hydratase [Oceanobacter sp. RED65] [Bermanella marisrubri]QIZ85614.1 enoyl-CoA hydratase [Bermanella marisrubri]
MISTDIENRILTIAFDRADKKNAITNEMYLAAEKALIDSVDNQDVRVVLFKGEGGDFTSGNDLVDFIKNPPQGDEPPVLKFLLALARYPKPVVAAVTGLAVGIGTTMLAHCDYVVAAEDARFKLPFVDLGVCPEGGSSLLFPNMMGHSLAAELLMLADMFGTQKADKAGLLNEVVAHEEVLPLAQKVAVKYAQKAPNAVRTTKAMLKKQYLTELEARVTEEIHSFGNLLAGPEAKEALQAFMEKRKPDFSQF